MSIQSAEDFDPTSSTPVFGSAVSQTKIQQQQQPNNDLGGTEKLLTPELAVNGQNNTTNNKTSDNLDNGNTESVKENTGASDSTDVHVNGQNGKTEVDTVPSVNATTKDNANPVVDSSSALEAANTIENPIQNNTLPTPSAEPTDSIASTATAPTDEPPLTGPEPGLTTSADIPKKDLSTMPTIKNDNSGPPAPGPPVETTSTPTSNDNVPASATAPEATVLAESTTTPEHKTKSPRGKAKSPIVSTPPTRQSSRSRKPASSSSQNEDDKQTAEEVQAPVTKKVESSPPPAPKRTKRQAATVATDAIQAGTSSAEEEEEAEAKDESDDEDAVPSDAEYDDDMKGSKSKKKRTPSPRKGGRGSGGGRGRKRVASSSPSTSKKKTATPKGKKSITSNDEQQMDVDKTEVTTTTTAAVAAPAAAPAPAASETVQTPPKRGRTSGSKKTPTSASTTPEPSGDYKRTHDEAFEESQNDLVLKLNQAVDFCKNKLLSNNEISLIQSEHTFNDVPFAEIATQQSDNIRPIQQILLTDYFLRASKLGIQTNILYTHDKIHPSLIDTAIGGQILLPENCRFLWSDMKNARLLVSEGTKYSFIVLDPPWANKSVRRKHPYNWSDFTDIKNLPVENLIERTKSSLICCWSTNCDKVEEFIKNELFTKWNCQYLTTWYWLKVTRSGEPVLDLTSLDKKSYETLILGYTGNDDDRFSSLKNTTKIICSIPALIHSTKPALHILFQDLINFPNNDIDHCLEIYARNLLPNFTSIGNEVLKHQSIDLFEEITI
ncbi:unnamed protein product [Adineta steineri]|uniref:Methyltransferase-like protein 4 n=1 Tax=Adineta steineri TaxID=433720 RepID=A0A814QZN1_9BILA|nr:unnamed protein product [Adineta steineri]